MVHTFRGAIGMKNFLDPVLGAFTYNASEEAWVADVSVDNRASFQLKLGEGDSEPDPELIAAAREIVGVPTQFCDIVRAFLERSINEDPDFGDFAGEIRALEVEDFSLFSAGSPNNGMIYFRDGLSGRVWRCDYVDRKPKNLGFDS